MTWNIIICYLECCIWFIFNRFRIYLDLQSINFYLKFISGEYILNLAPCVPVSCSNSFRTPWQACSFAEEVS